MLQGTTTASINWAYELESTYSTSSSLNSFKFKYTWDTPDTDGRTSNGHTSWDKTFYSEVVSSRNGSYWSKESGQTEEASLSFEPNLNGTLTTAKFSFETGGTTVNSFSGSKLETKGYSISRDGSVSAFPVTTIQQGTTEISDRTYTRNINEVTQTLLPVEYENTDTTQETYEFPFTSANSTGTFPTTRQETRTTTTASPSITQSEPVYGLGVQETTISLDITTVDALWSPNGSSRIFYRKPIFSGKPLDVVKRANVLEDIGTSVSYRGHYTFGRNAESHTYSTYSGTDNTTTTTAAGIYSTTKQATDGPGFNTYEASVTFTEITSAQGTTTTTYQENPTSTATSEHTYRITGESEIENAVTVYRTTTDTVFFGKKGSPGGPPSFYNPESRWIYGSSQFTTLAGSETDNGYYFGSHQKNPLNKVVVENDSVISKDVFSSASPLQTYKNTFFTRDGIAIGTFPLNKSRYIYEPFAEAGEWVSPQPDFNRTYSYTTSVYFSQNISYTGAEPPTFFVAYSSTKAPDEGTFSNQAQGVGITYDKPLAIIPSEGMNFSSGWGLGFSIPSSVSDIAFEYSSAYSAGVFATNPSAQDMSFSQDLDSVSHTSFWTNGTSQERSSGSFVISNILTWGKTHKEDLNFGAYVTAINNGFTDGGPATAYVRGAYSMTSFNITGGGQTTSSGEYDELITLNQGDVYMFEDANKGEEVWALTLPDYNNPYYELPVT